MNGRLNHRASQTHMNHKISLSDKTSSVDLGVCVCVCAGTREHLSKGGRKKTLKKINLTGGELCERVQIYFIISAAC